MEVHELAKQVQAFHEEMRKDMAVLKRGVYGDPANRVRGLLDRQDADEKRMGDIEDRLEKSDRRGWKLTTAVGTLFIGLEVFWKYILGK